MTLVFCVPDETGRNRVTLIHYKPDELPDEIRGNGIEIREIPKPDCSLGKIVIPYVDLKARAIYYEYIDNPQQESEGMES